MPYSVYQTVEVFWRASDDAADDAWYVIALELVPPSKAEALKRVLAMFDEVGDKLSTHTLCWPQEYAPGDGNLSEADLKEMKELDFCDYAKYAPPAGAPCDITARYVVHESY